MQRTAKDYSDLDLAIVGDKKINLKILADIKEAFEESELPYRVDVLDWNAISENFRKIINEKYEVIQKTEHDFDDENGLPDGWNLLYVKDVANVNEATIDKKYKFEKIEYIDIASVENRQIIEFQNHTLSDAPSRAKRIVKRNDILISTVRPNLKHFTILKNINCNTIASTGFAVITAKKIDPYFLYYSLTTDEFTNYLSRIADSHTSTYPSFNPDIIENAKILVPSIDEQKSIASILSSLDDKIELNRVMNETLEKTAQAIFKHWFIDFEFPDENGKPYKSSGGKMVETESGEVPKNWKFDSFSKIIEITSGKRPTEKSELKNNEYSIPLIGASSLMGYVKKPLYSEPIIIIGRVGTHGVVQKLLQPSFPSDNTLVIISRFYCYTYNILKNIDYTSLNIGSTQPLITQSSIKEYKILIPSEHTLYKFEETVWDIFILIYQKQMENQVISKIRDLLLPKLMSGKIRVKA